MFQLAGHLKMTVAELEQRMSSAEIAEWIAYTSVEPNGDRRSDYQAAMIAAVMVNMWRGKGSRTAKMDDYIFKFWRPQKQPWQQMKKMLDIMVSKTKKKEVK